MNYYLLVELLNDTETLTVAKIENWIFNNKEYFKKGIENSICGKWQKYANNGETPFPCCCHTKEKDCLFIELYYNLENLVKEEEPDLFYITNIIQRTLKNF